MISKRELVGNGKAALVGIGAGLCIGSYLAIRDAIRESNDTRRLYQSLNPDAYTSTSHLLARDWAVGALAVARNHNLIDRQ